MKTAALLVFAVAGAARAQLTVKAIAAEGPYGTNSFAVMSDGSIWQWGNGSSTPVRVNEIGGVAAVTGNLALKDDGTVWTWRARTTPVEVEGLTAVAALSATADGNLALKRDGTVWAWGWSGVVPGPRTPVQVSGLSGFVRAIAGGAYCLALKLDGTVWGWSNTAPSSTPRQVSGLAGVAAIALAGDRGVAAKSDGTVWEWRIVNADPNFPAYPETLVQVTGLTGVVSLAATWNHRLALKADGTVWEWTAGTGNPVPAAQVSGLDSIVAVAAGPTHSLALKNDGTMWAWGSNTAGELGDGTPLRRAVPVKLRSLAAASVAAGTNHSLALRADGTVLAWGGNDCRQLGEIAPTPRSEPLEMPGVDHATAIAAGGCNSLVRKSDGTVWTAYDNTYYYQPAPDEPPRPIVRQAAELDGMASAVPGFENEVLAVKPDGTLWQWWGGSEPPVLRQIGGLSGIAAVTTGQPVTLFDWLFARVLALSKDGRVWEWSTYDMLPFLVGDLKEVIAVASGRGHGLALKADGTVWAWGFNADGQLGDGTNVSRTNSAPVSGLTGVVAIAAGEGYSVAVKRDGTVWAWGANRGGQLGDGTTTSRTIPVQVTRLRGITAVSARAAHTLAVDKDGAVWAWGVDASGQLGAGRLLRSEVPVQVIPPGSPDLAITMSHPGDFAVGSQGVYTLTITNTGLSATSGAVTVADSLPAGLTYVSAGGAGWTCSAADQEVTCTNPDPVAPGASTAVMLTVTVGPSASPGVTNLATVSNDSDRTIANNSTGDPAVVSAR